MIFVRRDGDEYFCDVEHKSVLEIANATKCVFDEFINDECNNVTDECCEYLLPLIEGEWNTKYEKGLPKHIIL